MNIKMGQAWKSLFMIDGMYVLLLLFKFGRGNFMYERDFHSIKAFLITIWKPEMMVTFLIC